MALILPEIKHEYLFHLDTEETKNSVFDQCRAEGKEAAYSTFGTAQNDSEYQPAPTEEPDYYMQYCSSDGYDYLKDYRLVWGYGIGIIEQDVICSLTTGEHLAEGKEACDAYATENIAGENIDWKRGIWLKFSGNRNNSPARIGEVILPEYIISLKDLCVALTPADDCVFEMFNTVRGVSVVTHLLNISNLCGQKKMTVTPNDHFYEADFFPLDVSYAFANATITGFDDPFGFWYIFQMAVNGNHCFYNANVTLAFGELTYFGVEENGDYESAFESCTLKATTGEEINYTGVVNKATFKNCNADLLMPTMAKLIGDCESAFEGCTIDGTGSRSGETDDDIDWNSLDFSRVTNAKRMFYNTSWVEDEVFLDLSSVVEHEDECFNNFLLTNVGIKHIYNIKAPDVKLKGLNVFSIYNYGTNIYPTINVIGELKYYDYSDLKKLAFTNYDNISYTYEYKLFGLINTRNAVITGTFVGLHLIINDSTNSVLLRNESNVILKTEKQNYTEEEISNINDYITEGLNYYNYYIPCALIGHNIDNNIFDNINIDDYVFIGNVSIPYLNNNSNNNSYKTSNTNIKTIDKTNKQCIILEAYGCRNNLDIKVNNSSDIYISVYRNQNKDFNVNDYTVINLTSDENYIISCLYYGYIELNDKRIGIIINAEKGELVFNKANKYQSGKALFDNINIINFDTALTKYDTINLSTKIKANKVNEVINSKHYYPFINYGGGSIALETNNTFIYNIKNSNSAGTIDITSDDLIEYPIIKHNNELNFVTDYNYFYGPFNNTKFSDVIKRISGYNQGYETLNFMLYGQTHNDELCIKDITEAIVLGSYDRPIYAYVYFALSNKNNNDDFNIENITLYINSLYLNLEPSDRRFASKNTTLICCSENKQNITLNNFIAPSNNQTEYSSVLNIIKAENKNVGNIEYFKLLNGYSNYNYMTINISHNIENVLIEDVCDNPFMRFKMIYINSNNNILKTMDIKLLDKLDKNSINSIVNPTNFASGCTLTINTIPFQYITEEQKQTLVDAGVTLVEYIPQTE